MWKIYRLYKRGLRAVKTNGNIDGRYLTKDFESTNITFRARTQEETDKKARKFWRDGCFGMGYICTKEEG